MRIGAYQFNVTNDIAANSNNIKKGIIEAVSQNTELIVFPECALTGYPPIDIPSSKDADFAKLKTIYREIQELSTRYKICIIIGSILKENGLIYNIALIFKPDEEKYTIYSKRALWGWDIDNFSAGNNDGIIEYQGLNIGIRICFEVRFPEYFRELYKSNTDLNIIMFYDRSNIGDHERYDIIKSHIITRAVENVCFTMTANTTGNFQTAPTCIVDKSGHIIKTAERNSECLITYNIDDTGCDFGEKGRKTISDSLAK